ncbi:MAG TPA: chemotaxis protein CheW [Bryobacteraceae bacterium]|nr:chemotaxis protein CheW [Bryobacteraceae bacterium]
MPWAIIDVKKRLFAIGAEYLRQIVMMPSVTTVPQVPSFVRGVINLRGKVIPLIDLRVRLGMTSVTEETEGFCKMLQDREEDHRRWLNELRRSVEERQVFSLATDPHKCAFGKWYDSYHSDDPWLASLLKKFDQPHKGIHALAAQVKEMQQQGRGDDAVRLITGAGGNILSTMVKLFAEAKTMVRESCRETVLAITVAHRLMAITADSAVAVEKLRIEGLPSGTMSSENSLVRRLGRRANRDEMVLIIEPERILDGDDMDSVMVLADRVGGPIPGSAGAS